MALEKAIDWAAENPVVVGVGVFAVGVAAILYYTGGNKTAPAPSSNVMVGNVGPNAELLKYGVQFQQAQLQANTALSMANTQASVESLRIGSSERLGSEFLRGSLTAALAQIDSDTFLGSKSLDVQAQKNTYDYQIGSQGIQAGMIVALDSNDVMRANIEASKVVALDTNSVTRQGNEFAYLLGQSSEGTKRLALTVQDNANNLNYLQGMTALGVQQQAVASNERLTFSAIESNERISFGAQNVTREIAPLQIEASRAIAFDTNQKAYGLGIARLTTQAQIAQNANRTQQQISTSRDNSGIFGSLLKIAAPIVGGAVAGPLGAAAGAAIGGFGGGAIDGGLKDVPFDYQPEPVQGGLY